MLSLQANALGDPALTTHLEEAARRVAAVAKAHDAVAEIIRKAENAFKSLGKRAAD